jgi:hypothetical protein
MGTSSSCLTQEETKEPRFTFSDTSYDVILDLATICSDYATTFMKMIPSLLSIFDDTTINIAFASEDSNTIDSVVVTTSTCGRLYPISPPSFTRPSPYLTFDELCRMAKEEDEWNSFISGSPNSRLPAIAESLYTVGRSLSIRVCAYFSQISTRPNWPSSQETCRRRLRKLVRLFGVLPLSFHLRGVQIGQFPLYGNSFSVR